MSRKIFLDIGAYNGMSADFFHHYYPDGHSFEIFCFEPDKRNIQKLNRINGQLGLKVFPAAAWTVDGVRKFYFGNDDGGSLIREKLTGNLRPENFYEVQTIDLAKFIVRNFSPDDTIIVKMNCEGAEYEIIRHLNEKKLLSWINRWYIQWHAEKIQLSTDQHQRIASLIRWHPWEVQLGVAQFLPKFRESL